MKKRDYRDYVQDILTSIKEIINFVADIKYEEFINDKKTINAVIRSIEVIGEATKKIPVEFKLKWAIVNWKNMSGMRDRLIHDYLGVNYSIVWDVIKNKIPELSIRIKEVLESENA